MIKKILFILSIMCLLQGCVPVVAGAAVGAAGGAVLYDRRPVKIMMQDDTMAYTIEKKLFANEKVRTQCHIVVTAYNGVVLLVGQAATKELKDQVTAIAKTVPKVKRIYNEVVIGTPTAYLIRTNDSWITTKVKTKLLTAKHLRSGQFKILTENGVVYMMGMVSRSQAQSAVNIVRHVDGVQKVVKVFEYTRVTETADNNVSDSGNNDKTAGISSKKTVNYTTPSVDQPPAMAQTDEALYRQNGA
jgi:osmotically-inducible protein OsmY